MGDPRVLSDQRPAAGSSRHPNPELAWRVLGWMGMGFLFVGGADIAIGVVPVYLGNPDWEFGTITQTLNGLPVPALGLAAVMAAAAALGRRRVVRLLAAVFALLAVLLIVSGVLYATNVPIGLRSVTDPLTRLGLKKAMAKSTIQLAGYTLVFLGLSVLAWRRTTRAASLR